jgi:hypothetical protein
MELDELKNAWVSVDERLKKQEILNESIIQEMIYKKTNKSLKQLFWSDSIGIPLLLLLFPFLVYIYGKFGGKHFFWDLTIIFTGVFCLVYLPFLIYRVSGLMKIDLSENIKTNLYYINRYSIHVKREKFAMFFFGPAMSILITLTFIEFKADASRWTLWICMFIFITLYTYWSYDKFYKNNIQSIKRNLEELEELKEE